MSSVIYGAFVAAQILAGKCFVPLIFLFLITFSIFTRKSHETTPPLAPPTPSTFPLDFAQLLQATTANPASRVRPRPSRSSKARRSGTAVAGRRESLIAEEEEGWDLVDGDGDHFGDGFP